MNTAHKEINNWVKSSAYDIKTASSMFKTGRYVYVVFMCHLSVEKYLKAIVCRATEKIPPKTHDLFYLIKLTGLDTPDKHKTIISHLNEASIPTRYPQDISKITKQYNKNVTRSYLEETKNLLKWLKKNIKLT